MKQIHITRDSSGTVKFETVNMDATENVFFTNEDPQAAHWPYVEFCDNQVGPSTNSSQCNVIQVAPPFQFLYKCKIAGHEKELGIINVFPPLAAVLDANGNPTLQPATKGTPIAAQPVVTGGMSKYNITGQQYQVTDPNGKVTSGSGIGPNLTLVPDQTNNGGITVSGTPTLAGTYQFTFSVTDGMGGNLQQVVFSMKVS